MSTAQLTDIRDSTGESHWTYGSGDSTAWPAAHWKRFGGAYPKWPRDAARFREASSPHQVRQLSQGRPQTASVVQRVQRMKPNKIMFLDLEVDNRPYFGALASPRHPDNYVVMNGYAIDETPMSGPVQVDHYLSKEEAKNWLHIPDDVWLVVAHNAPFELDWASAQCREELERFYKRGGKFFCTAYAHYLLSNQQETYPALNAIAPLYGGTPKVDGVKALWEAGHLTSEIDPELLREYLAGPGGDIDNTRRVFYGQFKKLIERGMWKMAMERMEGMLFCAEAMHNGLYVYRDLAMAQLREGEAKIAKLREEFAKHRAEFPEDAIFMESSAFHMSAWIYGGPLKYKARVYSEDAEGNRVPEKADFYLFADGTYVEATEDNQPGSEAFADLEFDHGVPDTYKAGKNKGLVKTHRRDTDRFKMKWGHKIHICPGIAPLGALPDDVRKSFDNEFTGKRVLFDGSPVYSTGKDAIEVLSKREEFRQETREVLQALLMFAKLDKDMGTYYLREEVDDDGNVIKQSGMLQFLNDKNFVHHSLNMTSTVTTRLSSNKPNFQNIPRGDTSDVKKMFTSRFGADGVIIEADYSALEVVTLAAFSKDKALVKALLDGIDMHCMRLAQQLDEPYEEVLKKCKDENHPDHKRYNTMRTNIKPKAFAYQYGATAHGIAFATGCSVEDAQTFIDAEKALFPDVEKFYDEQITPIVEKNVVRHREEVDGQWRIYGTGTWQAPGGTTYEFRQYPKNVWIDGKQQTIMQFKPTQIRNYPIQGESGFFVQGICGKVFRALVAKDFFRDANGMQRVYIINTVHDAIYLDCHKSVLDEVAALVKEIMESLPQHFNEKLGYDLQVPFPAAVEFGASMYQKIHWHPGVLDTPAKLKDDGTLIPSVEDQLANHLKELQEKIEWHA